MLKPLSVDHEINNTYRCIIELAIEEEISKKSIMARIKS